jgi:hypothetical protein
MDSAAVSRSITERFDGVEVMEANGDTFYFVGPDRRMPFATLVRSNFNDAASDLDRPGVFRLNIGASKATYESLFGRGPARPDAEGVVDTGHDFAALDRIMPHPVYAPQFWVCVLNPGATTWHTVQSLIAEAYERAARRRPTPAPPPPGSAPG